MRTAGIIAGVIATASANLYPYENYSNTTTTTFTSAAKEIAEMTSKQVVEGNEALVKGTVKISSDKTKAAPASIVWSQSYARGAKTNPPTEAKDRFNAYFTNTAGTWSSSVKNLKDDLSKLAALSVAEQLDVAASDAKISA
jgi:hypothetical protein